MIYIAKHLILITCDSLCDSEMDERYLEDVHNDLKDALCSFIISARTPVTLVMG